MGAARLKISRMKIAQVAPLYEAVPPRLYGGTERIISYLTEGLVARGHDVTLFGSADSQTTAKLVAVRDCALRLDTAPLKCPIAAHLNMLDTVRRRVDEFDIIHFHLGEVLQFPLFEQRPERTVTTAHGRLDLPDFLDTFDRWPAFPMVSISMQQRQPLPRANWVANIHHGLPPSLPLPFEHRRADTSPYLAFLGRIAPEKRPDRAIEIARQSGLRLKIAAKVDEADKRYHQTEIEPRIDGERVQYIGEISEAEKPAFLGGATALLFPIDWPEPFGLVVIEAMAFGTPVIAWRRGAAPEVIDHGQTGFLVETIEEAVASVAQSQLLSRAAIRRAFERRFSADRMTSEYEAVYETLLRGGGKRRSRLASSVDA
jgi:glycosyltransferase involved in cell wall biosynthesis